MPTLNTPKKSKKKKEEEVVANEKSSNWIQSTLYGLKRWWEEEKKIHLLQGVMAMISKLSEERMRGEKKKIIGDGIMGETSIVV